MTQLLMQPERWQELSANAQQQRLMRPAMAASESVKARVAEILAGVSTQGATAVSRYSQQFDGNAAKQLLLPIEQRDKLAANVEPRVKQAIDTAYQTIRRFHQAQQPQNTEVETAPGVVCQSRYIPLQAVGLYIPGGSASLPSTALMLGVPAQLAGCPRKVLASPASADGEITATLAYVAQLCEIDEILVCGGAQAIAALAYGIDDLPPVDKIFGPGNAYVTEAKQQVSQSAAAVAIDMPAGPSELLVIADDTANPAYVAADLLSQAEHGPDSQVLLLTPSESLANAVAKAITDQCQQLPRREIAQQALANSRLLVTESLDMAVDVAERYAPEHLSLQFDDAEQVVANICRAGSIFVGHYTPESGGDYATGTNHVLPTYGFAKSYSSLGLTDFYRRCSVQQASREGLAYLSTAITTLAEVEGLEAHKRAVTVRLKERS